MNRIELFKELTEAFGPSGYETDVVRIMKKSEMLNLIQHPVLMVVE
jgi:putative aminopeptidase FrvX